MMFRPLHTIAQAATLHMIIVAEGEQLRVTLQPKPTGKDAPIPAALSLVATPEEFDAGFVDAITTWRAPATSLVEQAAAAAAQPASPADTKAGKPAAKAPAKKAAKPAPKKKAAPEPNAGAQVAEAATPGPQTSGVATPDAPAPTTAATAEQDRLACIADMRAYLAGNAASEKPAKPSRTDYLKKFAPATGRRYERLFTSFDEFVGAAQQQALPGLGEAEPNAEAQQPGEPNQTSGSDVVAAAPDAAAGASAPTHPVDVLVEHLTEAGVDVDAAKAETARAICDAPVVALKDLQAPADDSTSKLFEGEPILEGNLAVETAAPAAAVGFTLDLI